MKQGIACYIHIWKHLPVGNMFGIVYNELAHGHLTDFEFLFFKGLKKSLLKPETEGINQHFIIKRLVIYMQISTTQSQIISYRTLHN